MAPVNVLIIFYSRGDRTEQVALAAAVGAVQARANIRIRWLPARNERLNTGNALLDRLQREYVAPTTADTSWADAVIIGMNDKIAGFYLDVDAATTLGRRVAADVRAFKQRYLAGGSNP